MERVSCLFIRDFCRVREVGRGRQNEREEEKKRERGRGGKREAKQKKKKELNYISAIHCGTFRYYHGPVPVFLLRKVHLSPNADGMER